MRELTVPPLAAAPQFGGLADAVFTNADERPEHVALGRKVDGEWRNVTAAEFRDQVLALAKGLLAQGVRFGDRVAIMSRTRYEWTLFDFALWSIGVQSVPVYPTSSSEQVRWILHDASVVACVVEHEDHAMTVGAVVGRLPDLTRMWQLDAGAVEELSKAGEAIDNEVVDRHRAAVNPDAIATVIYTSGTTGRPKGCVLTHANFMAECDNLLERFEPVFRPSSRFDASTLLFLPLAHVFGRMVQVAALRGRVRLAHQPNMAAADLLPDFASFRPTFVLAVPYVFEKVFQSARRKAEAAGKAGPFDKAVEVAVKYAEAQEAKAFGTGPGPTAGLRVQHQFFDKVVYSKVRDALGGRVRHGISGGSAMERRLGLFFAGAGVTIFEGYGLTESTAAVTANPPEQTRFGTVGQPVPGTTVHIAEDGEIWLRGDVIFGGYLNDPKSTSETLRDGWLATGDIGTLDEDGYLTITGRKKEIIVTNGGKSVADERVRDSGGVLGRVGDDVQHTVGQAAGLRREDMHFMPDSTALGCLKRGSHLHTLRRDNVNGAWAKRQPSAAPGRWKPVDHLVVQAYDQYVLERMALPHGPASDFVLVNLFAEPLGAPMTADSLTELLGRLSRRAGLPRNVTPRMLRRAAGSNLGDSGAGLDEIAALLDHARLSSSEPYLTPAPDRLRSAIEAVPSPRELAGGPR